MLSEETQTWLRQRLAEFRGRQDRIDAAALQLAAPGEGEGDVRLADELEDLCNQQGRDAIDIVRELGRRVM